MDGFGWLDGRLDGRLDGWLRMASDGFGWLRRDGDEEIFLEIFFFRLEGLTMRA